MTDSELDVFPLTAQQMRQTGHFISAAVSGVTSESVQAAEASQLRGRIATLWLLWWEWEFRWQNLPEELGAAALQAGYCYGLISKPDANGGEADKDEIS